MDYATASATLKFACALTSVRAGSLKIFILINEQCYFIRILFPVFFFLNLVSCVTCSKK